MKPLRYTIAPGIMEVIRIPIHSTRELPADQIGGVFGFGAYIQDSKKDLFLNGKSVETVRLEKYTDGKDEDGEFDPTIMKVSLLSMLSHYLACIEQKTIQKYCSNSRLI